jgi:hypothetical protein
MPRTVEFEIEHGDITTYQADVLVLKYAQAFYGADELVVSLIPPDVMQSRNMRPKPGEYRLVETKGAITTPWVLFVGVEPMRSFRYEQIREFASRSLAILSKEMPEARHISMTMHGVGTGLDETEAILSQLAGLLSAMEGGNMPESLERISIVDRNGDRVDRIKYPLVAELSQMTFAARVEDEDRWAYRLTFGSDEDAEVSPPSAAQLPKPGRFQHPVHPLEKDPSEADEEVPPPATETEISRIESAGVQSEAKPHAFIAMPFKKEFDDIFYYGIQQPVHMAGLLCERVDKDAFSGGIMEYVKHRIETAAVVVAELTGANPNVYLEVGYAWGKGRPVILLVQDENQLHFDVKGQRCLVYERIKDLEEALSKELRGMMAKGIVAGQNAQ